MYFLPRLKIEFQDAGGHSGNLGFLIGTILAIFDLHVTAMLPTKAENRFSRWQRWGPSWISDLNYFSYLLCISQPGASYQVSSQFAFQFRRRSEKWIFKMAATAAILDLQSEQFEIFFIYKSPRCFLPIFKSTGLSVQEKKRKIDFQHGSHLGFPFGNNFS